MRTAPGTVVTSATRTPALRPCPARRPAKALPSDSKRTTLRWYGPPPAIRVVLALARFSVMTFRRARCAARAEALMASGSLSGMPALLGVAVDGRLQGPELAVQELEHGRVVHRVLRHARHLPIDVDAVAVGARHGIGTLDEAEVEARRAQRGGGQGPHLLGEGHLAREGQVAGLEAGRVRVGHVLGEQLVATRRVHRGLAQELEGAVEEAHA